MKKYSFVIGLFLLFSCSENEVEENNTSTETESSIISSVEDVNNDPVDKGEPNNPSEDIYASEAFEHEQGWGYKIVKNGEPIIIQTNIPSIPGVSGFSSKEKAEIAGEYVSDLVKNGVFPPTVNAKILDSLGVLD